jgi:NADH-quinone oxidoreductase subunit N
MKRFFAYSSISQAGYILLGVLHGSESGLSATLYFVFVYVFSNLAAFGVIAAVENASGKTAIADYKGLYRSNPRLALVMMLAVFSLAGIPPLGGFFSKFFIFAAAAEGGDYVLVFIALANTVLSLYYYLRIVRAMFIDTPDGDAVPRIKTDGYNRAALIVCTAGMLAVGIVSWFYNFIAGVGY